ncbi:MAG: 16S rRNA processing protein RimM [Alphaproteobacteria bacterium]|nr:16S rRNA processing protein RimM [Alphaproteobacteria bacterium]MBQ8678056.1 16S rRNA processing protein RimM [Alphaproteobacteria bacterium]
MTEDKRICIGAIVGVHGIKGEVKVKSFTEPDTNVDKYGCVENKNADRKFELKVVGYSKELLRVKIKGINDRNAAEALVGTGFYIDRSVLPELDDEDEFYEADLVGLKVLSEGQEIGSVAGLYNFGAGEIIEIKLKSNGKLEMIPFTKAYVPDIKISEGYITVTSVGLAFAPDEEDGASDAKR